MTSYEKNIEKMQEDSEFLAGNGLFRSAWDIDWADPPFTPAGEALLSPLQMISALKDTWDHGTPTNTSAVYIHIPFCRLACTYCAFYKKKADDKEQHSYAKLLCKEIRSLAHRPYVEKSHVQSIFFGGGTPGILSAADISAILEALHDTFHLTTDTEITMESSLSDMTDEKMDVAIAGGVNRFSFGVQSFQTAIRNGIGRPLPREAAMEKLAHFAKKDALMILDLIYGLPGETADTMRQDIRDAKAAGAAGLDLYKLQLLPGSPLTKSFEKAGKQLEIPYLQELFRAAEEELLQNGATSISCTHWKWDERERSLYNTLASNGSDIFPLGMACGGKIGNLGLMKPLAEAMYRGAVALGKFAPMGARIQSPYQKIYSAIEAAGDSGILSPAALEKHFHLPFTVLLTPLLSHWIAGGLVSKDGETYHYTAAGRYWYRTMLRRLLHATQYMLTSSGTSSASASRFRGMMNMK